MSYFAEKAALWRLEQHPPFRGEKDDIAVRIIASTDGRILCSDPQDHSVLLLTEEQSQIRGTEN